MKKTTMVLLAASLLTASVPAISMARGGMNGQAHDEQCQKDCDMFVKNCGSEVDSLQQRIQKLESALKNDEGGYNAEQLGSLKSRLEDAQRTFAVIEGGGA